MYAHDVVLIGGLVDRCPSLLPVLQEHLDTYDELLSHLFMADVTRWAAQRYQGNPSDPELITALDYLNSAFKGARNDDRELIAVSFLENLPRKPESGHELRNLLRPELLQHMTRHRL